jgi:hypothetical protein
MTDSTNDLRTVHFQLLAARAAVPALAAEHIAGYVVLGYFESRRDALEDGSQVRTVGFSGG